MKKHIFCYWYWFPVFVLFLLGCQGNAVYPESTEGVVVVNPDLTSKCIISVGFTQADYDSVTQSSNWDDPQKEFAHQVAVVGLGWKEEKRYTYQYRSENGLIWVDLYTEFELPQDLDDLVGEAQSQSDIDVAEAKMGEAVIPSSLTSYTTPYTDAFELQYGIVVQGNNGQYKWSFVMPGTIYDTNGTLLSSNQAVWSWSVEEGGKNMVVKSAGLTEFSTVWIIDVVDNDNANLSLALYGNEDMFDLAAKMYGKGNTDELIAKRVASGLNLPAYTVTSGADGDNFLIKLSMKFSSIEGMNSLLKDAKVLQNVDYSYTPGLLSNSYQFSASIPTSTQEIGYSENTSVILNLPGTVETNATTDTNGKPTWSSSTSDGVNLSASSKKNNVTLILILGASLLCLVVLGGAGTAAFLVYRKRSSKSVI